MADEDMCDNGDSDNGDTGSGGAGSGGVGSGGFGGGSGGGSSGGSGNPSSQQPAVGAADILIVLRQLLDQSSSQTQYLSQSEPSADLNACLLEKIARIVCMLANETHAQRRELAAMRADMATLLELYKGVHPEQALQLEKIERLRAEMEACCPTEKKPELICCDDPAECRIGNERGSGHSVKSRGLVPRIDGGDDQHPVWTIDPHTLNDNEDLPHVPQGRIVGRLIPAAATGNVLDFRSGGGPAPSGGAQEPVTFRTFTNGSFTEVVWPPDMSGAKSGDVVLMSANLWLRLSLDGGKTFTDIDFTKVFAADVTYNGWNGDQVVIYVPQIDCFVLYVQSNVGTGVQFSKSVVKIAIASTADIKTYKGAKPAWRRQWDFNSDTFGLGQTWLDFPDMSFGTDYLYVNSNSFNRTVNAAGKNVDTFAGKLFWELPLKDMLAGKSLSFQFSQITASLIYGSPTQNISDENYWAAHVSNSKMRVFNSKGTDANYQWRDIDINNWPQATNNNVIIAAPDSTDWCSEDHRIIGATKVGTQIWFAWTGAAGNGGAGEFNFPQAHIQIAKFDVAQDYKLIEQTQVWNASIAFAYASLATNSDNEVGISLAWGGGSNYGSHAVGILGDFVVWFGEASNMTSAYLNPTRFGDYLHCRLAYPDTRYFSGFGYAVKKVPPPTGGESPDYLYVEFGRDTLPAPGLH